MNADFINCQINSMFASSETEILELIVDLFH